MRGVNGLENPGQGFALGLDTEPLRGVFGARRVMAQRFEETPHPLFVLGRAEKHRHHLVVGDVFLEELVDFLLRRHHVLDKLGQQVVVEIG